MFYSWGVGHRHVWVKEKFGPRMLPGFLLAWRQTPDGWEALVTWAASGPDMIMTDWVPAERLAPVAAERPGMGTAYG
ncbi:hypothetical protein GCM10022237_11640 [Nocardioides ginsengisoli]